MSKHISENLRAVSFFDDKEGREVGPNESPCKKWHEMMRDAADWLEQNPRHFLEAISLNSSDTGRTLTLHVEPMDKS